MTLFTVAYHVNEGWWVHPKLPGLKSVLVGSEREGKVKAEGLWLGWWQIIEECLAKDGLN